jgi:two-component sensor histidine kinase
VTGQVDHIELGGYLSDIARSLLRVHEGGGGTVRLFSDTERIDAAPELAINLGLVTNEFVTNSLKYAFKDTGGSIGIELKRLPNSLVSLQLWDDGKGLPTEVARGSGMILIESLARPMATDIQWSPSPGVRLTLLLASL